MKIKEVINYLEYKFPTYWQEDFDNTGIQCGDKEQEITAALVCFEFSEKVLEEAIAIGANFIVSHHPLQIVKGLLKIEPTNTQGKIIFKAIENHLVLYSMHTNIDSGIGGGNDLFAEKLNLTQVEVLAPQKNYLKKIAFFIPEGESSQVKNALFSIGCGEIGNYSHCSYSIKGEGNFLPLNGANPTIGDVGHLEKVNEERIEMVFPTHLQQKVVSTLYQHHPYEEPAFDIISLDNCNRKVGLGRIGYLKEPMQTDKFINYLKEKLLLKTFRMHGNRQKEIHKVALCGGGGASFIRTAYAAGADCYICGDIKYHEFFSVGNQMIIADIGHYESEHFIKEIIYNLLIEKFSTFASSISKSDNLEINFV